MYLLYKSTCNATHTPEPTKQAKNQRNRKTVRGLEGAEPEAEGDSSPLPYLHPQKLKYPKFHPAGACPH